MACCECWTARSQFPRMSRSPRPRLTGFVRLEGRDPLVLSRDNVQFKRFSASHVSNPKEHERMGDPRMRMSYAQPAVCASTIGKIEGVTPFHRLFVDHVSCATGVVATSSHHRTLARDCAIDFSPTNRSGVTMRKSASINSQTTLGHRFAVILVEALRVKSEPVSRQRVESCRVSEKFGQIPTRKGEGLPPTSYLLLSRLPSRLADYRVNRTCGCRLVVTCCDVGSARPVNGR